MKIRIYKQEESSCFNCSFRYVIILTKDGIVDTPMYSDDLPMDIRKLKRFIRKGFNL